MHDLKIGSINIELHRKAIKNLHISVLPPDGAVRVAAPDAMSETAIRMAVISRIPWIRKQQQSFSKQARQSEREMLTGECHYLWGGRYRLEIIEGKGKHQVTIKGGRIKLLINPNTSPHNRAKLLEKYYRTVLKDRISSLLPVWQEKLGVIAADWGVKKMKTKWGSCNIDAKRIWINLELAKKPVECLEYILVHELVHLIERHHNDAFKDHLDTFLPDWRERCDLLNRTPLAHVDWS
ncbi:MAG: M48 family metallopeptidase [Cellvibrio sp.]